MSNVKCKNCELPMTWAKQRVQYGRLLKRGYSQLEAKTAMHNCQKCVTLLLKEKENPKNNPQVEET